MIFIDTICSMQIGLQGYRSMPIAQFNRFARVSIDIYWQYNRSARVWIDTYCLQIYTLLLRTTYLYRTPSAIVRMGTLDDSSKYLDVLLAFCFQTADLRQYLVEVLIDDRFVRISIDSCCCCWTTETPLATFFSTVSIIQIRLDLLGKEIGIHRQVTTSVNN